MAAFRRPRAPGEGPVPRRARRRESEERPSRPFPFDRYGALAGALSALAFGLVLARAETWGPRLVNDSTIYHVAAQNLVAGDGLVTWDSAQGFEPYVWWPPLYAGLLAAALVSGLELLPRVHFVGAAFFALTVLAVGGYARRRFRSPFFRVWTPLAAALSLPFARYAWSGLTGAPFACFTLLSLFSLDRFLSEGRRSSLVWSAVFAGLAFSTRYQGVVLLGFAGGLLALTGSARLGKRIRTSAAYLAIAGLPLAVWLARNYRLTGTLTGPRAAPDYETGEILADIGRVVLGWGDFGGGWPLLLAGGALVPLAARLLPQGNPPPSGAGASPAGRAPSPAWIFGGFAFCFLGLYSVALLLEQTSGGVEARHLLPARLPLLLALASALDPLFLRNRKRPDRARVGVLDRLPDRRTLGAGAAAALLSVWAVGQIGPQRRAIARANSPEVEFANGFLGEPWASSETLGFLRADSVGGPRRIHTNLRTPVFLHSGGQRSIRTLPDLVQVGERRGAAPSTPQERLGAFLRAAPEGARIVWSTDFTRPPHWYRPPAALFDAPGLRPLAEFADGAVFAVDPEYAPSSNRFREAWEFLRTSRPDADAAFEVFLGRVPGAAWDGPLLSYSRTPCRAQMLDDRFFLQVHPEDPEVLPAEGAAAGFETLDFDFLRLGALLTLDSGERACVATVRLPDYGISRIRTGQDRDGEGASWSVEIRPE